MIVVADTSPLVALINIHHVEVLPRLFGAVLIPPAVLTELAAPPPSASWICGKRSTASGPRTSG